MRFTPRFVLLLAFCSLQSFAQDAQSALATSVGYNTRRLSMKLTPEQSAESAKLGQQAAEATRNGKFKDALRFYEQGTVVMLGGQWTPEAEYVSGLRASV